MSALPLTHTHSLISGGGDIQGTVAIHDTWKPLGCDEVFKCPIVTKTVSATARSEVRGQGAEYTDY